MVKKKTNSQVAISTDMKKGLSIAGSIILVLYVIIYPVINGDSIIEESKASFIRLFGKEVSEVLFPIPLLPIFILSLLVAYGLVSRKGSDGFNTTYNTVLYGIGIGIIFLIPYYSLNFLLNFSL